MTIILGFRLPSSESEEITRMMLGNGIHRGIVASTIPEIRGALSLARDGQLDEVCTSIASHMIFLTPSTVSLWCAFIPGRSIAVIHLSKSIKILLMIDDEQQLDLLESFAANTSCPIPPWSIFVKIDVGSSRAGLTAVSPYLLKLVQRIESSPAATLHGFYCHAGHSYASRTENDALQVLQAEFEGVVQAARLLVDTGSVRRTILSVGATPTAHVVSKLQATLPPGMILELNAGMIRILPRNYKRPMVT